MSDPFLNNINFVAAEIGEEARREAAAKSAEIVMKVYELSKKSPTRLAEFYEGAIAIVYGKKSGFLKRKYRELFIEVFTGGNIAYLCTENYKLICSGEITNQDVNKIAREIVDILEQMIEK